MYRLTEISGTCIDAVPNLSKFLVPVIPAVYTDGTPRYVPHRTYPCLLFSNYYVRFCRKAYAKTRQLCSRGMLFFGGYAPVMLCLMAGIFCVYDSNAALCSPVMLFIGGQASSVLFFWSVVPACWVLFDLSLASSCLLSAAHDM